MQASNLRRRTLICYKSSRIVPCFLGFSVSSLAILLKIDKIWTLFLATIISIEQTPKGRVLTSTPGGSGSPKAR